MKKLYDVYFTLAEEACITIEASSNEEAEEIFNQMTKDEHMERISDAVEFMGVEVTEIEEVDYV